MTDGFELIRRYRSAWPLRREILLAGMAVATFLLSYDYVRARGRPAYRRRYLLHGEAQPKMSAIPLWVQYAQAAALVALAVIGAFIAYRQWRTAHNVLRLNLFDRRFEIYIDALTFIGNVLQRGYPENEDYPILLRARDRAQFLFGPEVVACLKNINDTAVALRATHHKLQSTRGEARQAATEDHHALFLKFTQFDANLTRVMRPYLRFSQVRER